MKKMLSFEFWQKFGKCLMVVIAVMPAAGLMVSIGNSLPLISDCLLYTSRPACTCSFLILLSTIRSISIAIAYHKIKIGRASCRERV